MVYNNHQTSNYEKDDFAAQMKFSVKSMFEKEKNFKFCVKTVYKTKNLCYTKKEL